MTKMGHTSRCNALNEIWQGTKSEIIFIKCCHTINRRLVMEITSICVKHLCFYLRLPQQWLQKILSPAMWCHVFSLEHSYNMYLQLYHTNLQNIHTSRNMDCIDSVWRFPFLKVKIRKTFFCKNIQKSVFLYTIDTILLCAYLFQIFSFCTIFLKYKSFSINTLQSGDDWSCFFRYTVRSPVATFVVFSRAVLWARLSASVTY
jgi:hypothetical protein